MPKVKDVKSLSDLRPISILPTLSKVVEKIVYRQIYDYLIDCKIMPDKQSGFRKGHSTTSALSVILDDTIRSIDKGEITLLTMLDFSKAFDTIDHSLLYTKLMYYGFDDTSVSFFKSYFNHRSQQVIINNAASNLGTITSGVPQGSILGPILFTIYTADLLESTKNSQTRAFADDLQIYTHFKPQDFENACSGISDDLNIIANKSQQMNLKLNGNKCSVICFARKKDQETIDKKIKISLNNDQLKLVNTVKNLGLIIDSDLRFKNHVSGIIKKSYVALKLLYSNYQILNFKLRKKLCETLVLPFLHYCLVIYYPCLDQITKYRLQKIQNNCCRFIFKLKKYDHVTVKIKELAWLKIEKLYQYHLAVFTYRMFSTSTPSYLRDKFHSRRSTYNINTNLRHSFKLSMPKFYTSIFQRSLTHNIVKLYNSVDLFQENVSVNNFRKKIKSYFLAN